MALKGAGARTDEQLTDLFKTHLPMKEMDPEFADTLKTTVLTEVATVLTPGTPPATEPGTDTTTTTKT